MNLQKAYQDNGYDVAVLFLPDENVLQLASDIFQDAATREAQASQMYSMRKEVCGLGIWYVYVGYSKGFFSGDVMKKISLGCPAAKTARLKEDETKRIQFVVRLIPGLGSAGVKPTAAGPNHTVLTLDNPQETNAGAISLAQGFSRDRETRASLCRLGFTSVEIVKSGKVIKHVSLGCK